jgi:hypothetical protein
MGDNSYYVARVTRRVSRPFNRSRRDDSGTSYLRAINRIDAWRRRA